MVIGTEWVCCELKLSIAAGLNGHELVLEYKTIVEQLLLISGGPENEK